MITTILILLIMFIITFAILNYQFWVQIKEKEREQRPIYPILKDIYSKLNEITCNIKEIKEIGTTQDSEKMYYKGIPIPQHLLNNYNIIEFIELIEKYRSITLENIREVAKKSGIKFNFKLVATSITGFSELNKCSLCVSAMHGDYARKSLVFCGNCIWKTTNGAFMRNCMDSNNEKSYNAIYQANSEEELLQAFRDRANHMEKELLDLLRRMNNG